MSQSINPPTWIKYDSQLVSIKRVCDGGDNCIWTTVGTTNRNAGRLTYTFIIQGVTQVTDGDEKFSRRVDCLLRTIQFMPSRLRGRITHV